MTARVVLEENPLEPLRSHSQEVCIILYIEGSGPKWYISSMLYSRDIPLSSGTLIIYEEQAWELAANSRNSAKTYCILRGEKKLTREKNFPGSFFSLGVKLIFRRSEATYLPQHRFRFLLCACAVAPLPLWLQAQSVNMSSMSRIVQRGESFDESGVANPWNWNWANATTCIEVECGDAVKTERVGTRFRKLTLAGHTWCIVCDKQLSYGSRGLATFSKQLLLWHNAH